MRTEDLIEAIASDAAAPRPWLAGRMAAALLQARPSPMVLLALDLGIRPDVVSTPC